MSRKRATRASLLRSLVKYKARLASNVKLCEDLASANRTLAFECADLKTINKGLVAQNVDYKTKIAEWELSAGIGVQDAWKRLNNVVFAETKKQVDRHVRRLLPRRKKK